MLGTPAATLRTWEERYGLVTPTRSGGGHRLYTRDQVEQLRFVADHVADGLSAADAHRLLADRVAGVGSHERDTKGATMLVLLAERDPHAADLTEYFLRTEGYRVVETSGSDHALRPSDARPDLAVIDLLVGGGRGLDMCRTFSAGGIPVLAVSTLDMQDAAFDAGAGAFLLKPLDPLRLISTVRDLLHQSAYLRARHE